MPETLVTIAYLFAGLLFIFSLGGLSAQESARRGYETNLKQNGYWLRRLETIHLLGGNPTDILTRTARIDALTPDLVKDAFKSYFPMDRYTVVTLVPEPAEAAGR